MTKSRRQIISLGALAVGGSAVASWSSGGHARAQAPRSMPKPQRTYMEGFPRDQAEGFLREVGREDPQFAMAQLKARKTLSARGFARPVHVARVTGISIPVASASRGVGWAESLMPTLHAEQYQDGYLIASTYNDSGNTSVMNVYARNTTTWIYSSCTFEMDTAESAEPYFYWEAGEDAGGGGGPVPGRTFRGRDCRDVVGMAEAINRETMKKAFSAFAMAGVACWLSGPGWGPCALAWGTAGWIGAAIDTLGNYVEACY